MQLSRQDGEVPVLNGSVGKHDQLKSPGRFFGVRKGKERLCHQRESKAAPELAVLELRAS